MNVESHGTDSGRPLRPDFFALKQLYLHWYSSLHIYFAAIVGWENQIYCYQWSSRV